MYATWDKNETKEIDMLHVKFGKPIPSWNKCPTLNETNLPFKQVAPNPRCLEIGIMPPPWPRHVKEDITMMTFHLFHIKTKVSNHVSLKFPFLGAILMYNILLRRRQESLPKLKFPHHSLLPSLLQTNLLQTHNKIWQIWTNLKWRQRH